MRMVNQIESEFDEIVRKFRTNCEMDLIVQEERMRINKILMRPSFRLDSVGGFSGLSEASNQVGDRAAVLPRFGKRRQGLSEASSRRSGDLGI